MYVYGCMNLKLIGCYHITLIFVMQDIWDWCHSSCECHTIMILHIVIIPQVGRLLAWIYQYRYEEVPFAFHMLSSKCHNCSDGGENFFYYCTGRCMLLLFLSSECNHQLHIVHR